MVMAPPLAPALVFLTLAVSMGIDVMGIKRCYGRIVKKIQQVATIKLVSMVALKSARRVLRVMDVAVIVIVGVGRCVIQVGRCIGVGMRIILTRVDSIKVSPHITVICGLILAKKTALALY